MTTLSSELEGALFSLAGTILALWVGRRNGFFVSLKEPRNYPPTFLLALGAFAIYFVAGLLVPYLLSRLLLLFSSMEMVYRAAWLTFLSSGAVLVALLFYLRGIYPPIRQEILARTRPISPLKDLALALAGWAISFPIVLFVGSLLEIILYLFLQTFNLPDQIAILFLKMTFGHPSALLLAIVSIVLFAPVTEELLFRGFLQNYLRRYFSPAVSIAIAALCFALFHYSGSQGWANVSLLGSLFLLACFLGYLYERQGSLLASIAFHALFNAVSVANLYFFGE